MLKSETFIFSKDLSCNTIGVYRREEFFLRISIYIEKLHKIFHVQSKNEVRIHGKEKSS